MKRTRWIKALAGLALLPALAQAQSSVTLYGLLDVAVASQNLGNGSVTGLQGGSFPSRFGVRGTEDLGGGLSATFQLESELNVDNGSGTAQGGGLNFQRISTVGLNGSFGDLKLGRTYTPAFLAVREHDALSYGYYNSMLVYTIPGGATTRYSNGLFYVSPDLGGLTIRAAYAMGERAEAPKSIGNNFGLAAIYKKDKLVMDAYYQVDKVPNAPAPTAAKSHKMMGLGGSYHLGFAQVMLGYGQNKTDGLDNKTTGMNVGVVVPVGQGEILGQVIRMKTDLTAGMDPAATAWGLTYRHFLSKRTTLYATTGQTRNNAAGQFFLTGTAPYMPAAKGADPRGFGIGIQHNF